MNCLFVWLVFWMNICCSVGQFVNVVYLYKRIPSTAALFNFFTMPHVSVDISHHQAVSANP